MERRSIEAVVRALNQADVRYLVCGGLAVVAHGYVRFTADIDLFLELGEENLRRALAALGGLGYRPRAPVALTEFADVAKRRAWVAQKGLTVFSLDSPEHPATEIDLFVEPPLDFDAAYARAVRLEVAPGLPATFVSCEDLLTMKRQAGRAQDVEDIEKLSTLRRARET